MNNTILKVLEVIVAFFHIGLWVVGSAALYMVVVSQPWYLGFWAGVYYVRLAVSKDRCPAEMAKRYLRNKRIKG